MVIEFWMRWKAELSKYSDGDRIISITDPGQDPANLAHDESKILRLQFLDIEAPVNAPKFTTDMLFSDEQAAQIIGFAKSNIGAKRIVVHCEGGVSRSAAVAKVVADITGADFDDSEDNIKFANKLVLSTCTNVLKQAL